MSKTLKSITIKHYIDDNPDTSFLGEYSNRRAKFSFDRKVLGDMGRNEYRYFNPGINPLEGKTQSERKELYKYALQDYERMESLNKGNWWFIGIKAEATIIINNVIQTISSGGLWGIESGSDRDYIKDIEKEELNNLVEQLKELGFSESEIAEIEIDEDDKLY